MAVAAGTRFGRYEIRSLIRKGGMGEVYLAQDTQLRRPVESRKAYQDFLALWKDADSDLPVLQEAKQEYEKLK